MANNRYICIKNYDVEECRLPEPIEGEHPKEGDLLTLRNIVVCKCGECSGVVLYFEEILNEYTMPIFGIEIGYDSSYFKKIDDIKIESKLNLNF